MLHILLTGQISQSLHVNEVCGCVCLMRRQYEVKLHRHVCFYSVWQWHAMLQGCMVLKPACIRRSLSLQQHYDCFGSDEAVWNKTLTVAGHLQIITFFCSWFSIYKIVLVVYCLL